MTTLILETKIRVALKQWLPTFLFLAPLILFGFVMISSGFETGTSYTAWLKLLLWSLPLVAAVACCLTLLMALLLGGKKWFVGNEGIRVEIRGDKPFNLSWADIAKVTTDTCSVTICLRDRDHYSINFVNESLVKDFRRIYEKSKVAPTQPKKGNIWQ